VTGKEEEILERENGTTQKEITDIESSEENISRIGGQIHSLHIQQKYFDVSKTFSLLTYLGRIL
jgi:hypothetical protein